MEKNDRHILKVLSEDKTKGFRLLFDAYYTPLCLFSLQMTDDFDAAEDIVQAFFVKFWEKDLHKRIDSNLQYYLFSSIRNNTIQHLRETGNMELLDISDTLSDDAMLHQLMYDDSNEEELRLRETQLYNELRALPEKEREALQKVILEEMSYKEAAQEMGISVNTIKTHLKRAMKKLRDAKIPMVLLMVTSWQS